MEEFLSHNRTIELVSKKPKVLVINTGGTFGFQMSNPGHTDKVYFSKNYLLTELKCGSYPTLNHNFDFGENLLENDFVKYWIYEIDPLLDSADMDMAHWNLICNLIKQAYYCFDGFVILHGTNTMTYSASALSFMINNLTKPIVFTGSIIPFSMDGSDAVGNLEGALMIAATKVDFLQLSQ